MLSVVPFFSALFLLMINTSRYLFTWMLASMDLHRQARKAKDLMHMKRMQNRHWQQLGIKANKLRGNTHFRDRNGMCWASRRSRRLFIVFSIYFLHQTSVIALNREWFFLECLKHKARDNGKSSWVPALQALWREGRRRLRHLHSQPAGVRLIFNFNKYLNSIDPSPKMKGRGKHGLRNCRSWTTLSPKTFSSLSTS